VLILFVLFDKGVIAEQGTHSELLKLDGIYAKLVQRQIQKMQNSLEEGTQANKEPSDLIDALLDKKDK